MRRLYSYVGPAAIEQSVSMKSYRRNVSSRGDVLRWVRETSQELDAADSATATFIIDEDGQLWIADRRSEHLACARGGRVLSAGEMTFEVSSGRVAVMYVSNQSTGYCPQPESWPYVATALDRADMDHSEDFDLCFDFRRCTCGQINIVKNEVYECEVCGSDLPRDWNLASTVGTS